MNFDKKIEYDNLKIYCSSGLFEFSNEFIKYFNSNIEDIKKCLGIVKNIQLIISLTDEEKYAGFVYGKSSFSGFFNDTGCFAYINLFSSKNREYMFTAIMHELVHHLYKFYTYGSDKKRITWVDEGLAQFLSNQKQELVNKEDYISFIKDNLNNTDCMINLNSLNHEDRSFGTNNGYNLSYIAIRYLYENNKPLEFLEIIKDSDKLIKIGNNIIQEIQDLYLESKTKL